MLEDLSGREVDVESVSPHVTQDPAEQQVKAGIQKVWFFWVILNVLFKSQGAY